MQQTRLQVFNQDGALSFDSGLRLGNLVEWRLLAAQEVRAPDGSYLYLVTVREFSGRVMQKYGTVTLEQGRVFLEHTALEELSQAQAVALESNRQADRVSAVDRVGAAALERAAADGEAEGQAGVDTRTQTTAEAQQAPGEGIDVAGTGTLNKVAKWTDNAGTLGDSVMFDNGTGVGVGATDLTDVLVAGNDKFKIVDGPMTFSFRDFSAGQGYFAIGSTNGIKGFVGHTNATDGFTMGTFSNHKLTIRTNSANRLTIDTSGNVSIAGNVGIGTAVPLSKLDVLGDSNSFFGANSGINSTGSENSFLGFRAGDSNSSGSNNTFVGMDAGTTNTTESNNTMIGHQADAAFEVVNATAIGYKAKVTRDNALLLGCVFPVCLAPNNEATNIGIGTSSPGAKLTVANGSVYIAAPNSLIITAPNGTRWFITVSNAGALSSFSVPCP